MRFFVFSSLLTVAVLLIAGCGFTLRGGTHTPPSLHTLVLESHDPYGPLARDLRYQLRLNNVRVVLSGSEVQANDSPILRLLAVDENRDTASIFLNGVTAEYSMMMTAKAEVIVPQKGRYPISAHVRHGFFDNPLAALAKDAEQGMIRKEMRQQVAEQLISRLMNVVLLHAGAVAPSDKTSSTDDKPQINTSEGRSPSLSP